MLRNNSRSEKIDREKVKEIDSVLKIDGHNLTKNEKRKFKKSQKCMKFLLGINYGNIGA